MGSELSVSQRRWLARELERERIVECCTETFA